MKETVLCALFTHFQTQKLNIVLLLLCSYNLESGIWNTVPINSGPVPRYGHSLAAYQVNTHRYVSTSLGTENI